ncbi:MAG: serine/threonine protein kinase [Planctomycetes bacterium]|nr:serine/threonine protein kinase [Planctomycetota bacterium]
MDAGPRLPARAGRRGRSVNDRERWQRAQALFWRLLELPVEAREAALDRAAGEDLAVAAEVRALLRGHQEAGADFLAAPPVGAAPGTGLVLGGCRLLELLGEGGMGTVWRARDERLDRAVAVKVLRGGVMSRLDLQRFEGEAAVLARLRHSSIAAVHAIGRAGAGPLAPPFFVLELVENGAAITAWAERRGVDRRGRVSLLLQVADAIQHAHQRGVVHRDLKPANVIVGDDGVPKVIDFGIAFGLDPGAVRETRHGQMLGTIGYASPEQCDGDPDAIDARTDVHALGLLGVELLARAPAFAVEGLTLPQALRLMAEAPARRARRLDPTIDRDLDAVLAKACAPERAARYASADAFADDLRAWLGSRPVNARPPSNWGALRLFVRRSPALAVALTVAVVSLFVGLAFSLHFAVVAADRAEVAERQRHTAQQLADSLQEIMRAGNLLGSGRELTMREALGASAAALARRRGIEPDVAAELHLTLGAAYRSLGRLETAEQQLREGLALLAKATGDTRQLEARLDIALAAVYAQQQRDEALLLLDRAEELLLGACGEGAPQLVEVGARRGGMLVSLHRAAAGERALRQVFPQLVEGGPTLLLAESQANLGTAMFEQGRLAEAEAAWRAAIATYDAVAPPEHPFRVKTLGHLANVLRTRDPAAAVSLAQEVVGITARRFPEGHTDVAQARAQLAFAQLELGDRAAAEAEFRAVIELRRAMQGADHPATLSAITDLGYCFLQFGDPVAARDALEPCRAAFGGADTAPAAAAALVFGLALTRAGDPPGGEVVLRKAMAARARLYGPENVRTQVAASALGECLLEMGRFAEAGALLAGAVPAIAAAYGDDHRETKAARARLARFPTERR